MIAYHFNIRTSSIILGCVLTLYIFKLSYLRTAHPAISLDSNHSLLTIITPQPHWITRINKQLAEIVKKRARRHYKKAPPSYIFFDAALRGYYVHCGLCEKRNAKGAEEWVFEDVAVTCRMLRKFLRAVMTNYIKHILIYHSINCNQLAIEHKRCYFNQVKRKACAVANTICR